MGDEPVTLVAYMSRKTFREWEQSKGLPPQDMAGDCFIGKYEVLFDDRMGLGFMEFTPRKEAASGD